MIFITVLNESQDQTLTSMVKKVGFPPFGRDLTSLACSPGAEGVRQIDQNDISGYYPEIVTLAIGAI
jgi:hypothetical protein